MIYLLWSVLCLLAEITTGVDREQISHQLNDWPSPSGNSQVSISFSYRIGRSTLCKIVRETCDALWKSLQPLYVKAPATDVSDQFDCMWNFPHCIGAIDGKHITIQAPANSGSTYCKTLNISVPLILAKLAMRYYSLTFVDAKIKCLSLRMRSSMPRCE